MTTKLIVSLAALAAATTLLVGSSRASQAVVVAAPQGAVETPHETAAEAVDFTKYNGKEIGAGDAMDLPAAEPGHLPNHIEYVRNLASGRLPEPGAWALMLIGFGGAGSLLRRSRRRARAASI